MRFCPYIILQGHICFSQVKLTVFRSYAKAMGYLVLACVVIFMLGFQSLNVFSNYWLTYWTEDPLLKNVSRGYTPEYESKFTYYLVWYTVIGVLQGRNLAVLKIINIENVC